MYGNEASVRHIFTLPVVHNTRFHVQSSRFLLTRNRCSVFLAPFFRLLPSNSPFFFFLMIFYILFFRLTLVSLQVSRPSKWSGFIILLENYSLGPYTRLPSFSFSRFIKFTTVSLFSLFSHDFGGTIVDPTQSSALFQSRVLFFNTFHKSDDILRIPLDVTKDDTASNRLYSKRCLLVDIE